jgi:hypothetical protein
MTGWWAAAFIAQWALVLVLAAVVVALARQVGTLHLRLGPRGALEIDAEGPTVGEAPRPAATAADGLRVRRRPGPAVGASLRRRRAQCREVALGIEWPRPLRVLP